MIVSESKKQQSENEVRQKANKALLNILKRFGSLVQHALSVDLKNESTQKDEQASTNQNDQPDEDDTDQSGTLIPHQDDCKLALSLFDRSIEAKVLAIDLISSIASFYIQDDEEDDEDSCESLDEEEATAYANEMDVDDQNGTKTGSLKFSQSDMAEFITIINQHEILSLLVKTIHNDDENSYQDADRIEHVYNSVKLIRNESLRVYLQLVENFFLNQDATGLIDNQLMDHLNVFMNLIANKSVEDLELFETTMSSGDKNESVIKLAELVYDLYNYFDSSKTFSLSIEHATNLVGLIKNILLKFRISILELCVRFARILGLIAIRMRNTNLDAGKPVINVIDFFIIIVKKSQKFHFLIFCILN